MSKGMASLAKDTAIYGISSMLGKFLNWCLVPMYTYVLTNSAEYGIVTNLYAWTALLLVILTYGMETGFFRFVNKNTEDPTSVYSSVLLCVGITSSIFAIICCLLAPSISSLLGYNKHSEYIAIMGIIVAMDAFGCIPFAYLRYQNRAGRFAILKLLMILINIVCNLFFLLVCPAIHAKNPDLIAFFYNPNYGVGYVFISNLISTISVTLMLLPEILKAKFHIDKALLKRILAYSLPLLILGIAGIMNQTIDKIIYPYLLSDRDLANSQLGIYGACFKVAMVMMVFTQAFRYAYEPFVFATNKNGDKRDQYADAMKFFIIFSLLIFLGMMFYLDILKYVIRSDYWEGLRIVPIVLLSYLFQGIYFNLSIWYKLIDKTYYGAILSLIGLVITLVVNVAFVNLCNQWFGAGYFASAGASLICFFIIMLISYFLGQKYYPINYDLRSIFTYFIVAMICFGIGIGIDHWCNIWIAFALKTILLIGFLGLIIKRDLPLSAIPVIGRFFKK